MHCLRSCAARASSAAACCWVVAPSGARWSSHAPTRAASRSRSVDPGQVVECEITGIGRVKGTVVAVDAPRAAALGVGYASTDSPEVRRVALGFDERVPERFRDNPRRSREKRLRRTQGIVGGRQTRLRALDRESRVSVTPLTPNPHKETTP